jgi:hypothetical protein
MLQGMMRGQISATLLQALMRHVRPGGKGGGRQSMDLMTLMSVAEDLITAEVTGAEVSQDPFNHHSD